jgi:bifunctional DNA-binding transcriptional regulator/antitoxin component of YhaV-PrlF toxin-antitoxin module
MQLRATIESAGKTAAGIVVPDEFVAALGSSRHPRVRVTLGTYTFRTSIASMGGRFMLPMTAETRDHAGVAAGDKVELDIEVDDEPREVAVRADLAAALDRDDAARRNFEALSYSNKRRIVIPIEGAKTEATRQRRIEKAVAALHDGRA